jgi:hypothetical protein
MRLLLRFYLSISSVTGGVVPWNAFQGTGRARFRGVSARYEADNPPNEIEVAPILSNCYNCGY